MKILQHGFTVDISDLKRIYRKPTGKSKLANSEFKAASAGMDD